MYILFTYAHTHKHTNTYKYGRYGVQSLVPSSLIVAREAVGGQIIGCVGVEMALVCIIMCVCMCMCSFACAGFIFHQLDLFVFKILVRDSSLYVHAYIYIYIYIHTYTHSDIYTCIYICI